MPPVDKVLLNALARDAGILAHQFDLLNDRVLLARIGVETIREASFLDQRILTPQTEGAWVGWGDVAAAAQALPAVAPGMIFHVGHCGSTLLSRLIEAAGGGRAVREPLALRTLAFLRADLDEGLSPWNEAAFAERFGLWLRLWARGGPAHVKATSMCGGLWGDARTAGVERGLFVFVRVETYLAALLGGPNSGADLKGFAQLRLRRARKLSGEEVARLDALSPGELAALSWLVETASAARAIAEPGPAWLKPVDFDEFLGAPDEHLLSMLEHLDAPAEPSRVRAALGGPLMGRYSKATEHAFTAEQRRALLDESRRDNASEIRRGLDWLSRTGASAPCFASALAQFA